MTKENIIVKCLLPYFINKKNRAITHDGDCVYNTEDGRHCFIGNFLLPKYKKQGINFIYNISGYSEDMAKYFNTSLSRLDLDLITMLQCFHDSDANWENINVTWQGLEVICNHHKLNFKLIKSKLIKGVKQHKDEK